METANSGYILLTVLFGLISLSGLFFGCMPYFREILQTESLKNVPVLTKIWFGSVVGFALSSPGTIGILECRFTNWISHKTENIAGIPAIFSMVMLLPIMLLAWHIVGKPEIMFLIGTTYIMGIVVSHAENAPSIEEISQDLDANRKK